MVGQDQNHDLEARQLKEGVQLTLRLKRHKPHNFELKSLSMTQIAEYQSWRSIDYLSMYLHYVYICNREKVGHHQNRNTKWRQLKAAWMQVMSFWKHSRRPYLVGMQLKSMSRALIAEHQCWRSIEKRLLNEAWAQVISCCSKWKVGQARNQDLEARHLKEAWVQVTSSWEYANLFLKRPK